MSDTARPVERTGHPSVADKEQSNSHVTRDLLMAAICPAYLAGEKAGEYVANHPDTFQKASSWVQNEAQSLWKDLSAGGWGAVLGAMAPEAGVAKALSQAGKESQEKASSITRELTPFEKETAAEIEKDILSGNLKALQATMHSFHGRGGELTNIMHKVAADLRSKGLILDYVHGDSMWGDEAKMHDEGHFTLFSENGGKALEVNTDLRMGSCLGGPVKKEKDGSYTDSMLGLSGDPEAFLNGLAAEAKKTQQGK